MNLIDKEVSSAGLLELCHFFLNRRRVFVEPCVAGQWSGVKLQNCLSALEMLVVGSQSPITDSQMDILTAVKNRSSNVNLCFKR